MYSNILLQSVTQKPNHSIFLTCIKHIYTYLLVCSLSQESDNEINDNTPNMFNNSNSNFNSIGNDSSKEYLNQSSYSYKGADSDRSSDVSDTEYVRFLHSVNKDNDAFEDMDTGNNLLTYSFFHLFTIFI